MDETMINWELFVMFHSDAEVGVVIHTPLYNWIADNHPIEFIKKLIDITDRNMEYNLLTSAAVMVQDVAENRHFYEHVNRGIPIVTMEALRASAIDYMMNTDGLSQLEQCGQAMASVLLRWTLESGGEWDEFNELMKRVFFASDCSLLFMVLDVLCTLPSELVTRFVKVLEPSIIECYALFPQRMIDLLERGNDHRPYFVLANVCGLFSEPQWSVMMEMAIMSPFFDRVHSPSRKVSAALSLKVCFDHHADFKVSTDMVSKMRDIITGLRYSRELSEKHAGLELYDAYARRVLNFPIQRK